MKMEEIKEPIGKLIIDSGLGEMTQDGLYLQYTDVITMMRTYAESQLKEVKELNDQLSGGQKLLLERIEDLHANEEYDKLEAEKKELIEESKHIKTIIATYYPYLVDEINEKLEELKQ